MTDTSSEARQVRGDLAQSCQAAAVSAANPLGDVLVCATCQAVTLDLARLSCPVDSSHGLMGETRMTAPEVVAHWIFSGQAGDGTGEPTADLSCEYSCAGEHIACCEYGVTAVCGTCGDGPAGPDGNCVSCRGEWAIRNLPDVAP